MTHQCDVKKAGEVEFRCYFQLAMFEWGRSYASYLVANEDKQNGYQAGKIFENIDELVQTPPEDVGA